MIVTNNIVILSNEMGLQISISDSIVQALRLPEHRIEQELRRELAVALYTQDILSFGKARELAEMDKYEFGQFLACRGVVRHYGFAELDDDLSYARSE
jgi:predicted HTH domain antitoxin